MKHNNKYLLTTAVISLGLMLVALRYWDYMMNPWTRDGQVRAEVIQITPRVSGPIVHLPVKDNQFVNKGDLLFQIDPRTFEATLAQAQAKYDQSIDSNLVLQKQVESTKAQIDISRVGIQQAKLAIKAHDYKIERDKAEYRRQQILLPQRASSQKSLDAAKAVYEVTVLMRETSSADLVAAEAALKQTEANLAKALAELGAPGKDNPSIRLAATALEQARLNLEFTQVRAPVDGYVTNLNLRLGSQAVANQPILALIDSNSFWVHGFFKETTIGNIRKGNKAVVTLMTYPDTPIEGYVHSLGWGIAQHEGSTGFELLPTVSPTFEWIRLAQRIPVRIQFEKIPAGIELRVGATASVLVNTDRKVSINQATDKMPDNNSE